MTATSNLPRAVAAALALAAVSTLSIAQSRVTLPDTVITATRFPEDAQPLPIGVSVITADEIRASGASTIDEALMRILGIVGRQDSFGGGEYNLDLRGFGASADNNQVVIVDGVRFSEADLSGTRVAGIPIESVERIEVLRGSGAVLYGEGATGGVIVITTRSGAGRERGNSASMYGSAGSFGLRNARANATVAGGGFALDASAEKRDTDNDRANFRSKVDAASLAGQWANETVRLGVRYGHDNLDTGLPGALTQAQFDADPHQTTHPDDHATVRNERTGVFGEAKLGTWQLAGEASHRTKQLRSLNSGYEYDYDIASSSDSLRAKHESRWGEGANHLAVGTDHTRWTRDVLGNFPSTAAQSSRSWYAKDDFTFGSGTRVSAGWRTESIEKDNSSALSGLAGRLHAWELAASHPVTPNLTAYARIGRSYRLANVDEFGFTSPGVILQPQTSRDAELGARWNYGPGKAELRAYRSLLENEIGYDPNAAGPYGFAGANVNFDPTRRAGVELDVRHTLSPALVLRVNAAVRNAEFREGPYAGKDVPLAPRETLAVRGDWTPAAGHRVTGGVNWVSSQHPDFDNRCTMPAYTTADVRYAYTLRQVELSLGIANLFDRRYYTQAFGCAAGVTDAIYPEAGRAFTAAARVSF